MVVLACFEDFACVPCCCNDNNLTTYEGPQKSPKKSSIKKKLNRKIGFASLRCRVKNSNQTIKWVSQAFPK